MEESVDRKLDAMTNETRASIKEITGRLYR
jgi:hypothetical protein